MSPHRPSRDASRAFTLLELAVAVVIAGVLAASVAPAWDRVVGAERAAGRGELARMLLLAREHAMARGQSAGVSIDVVRQELAMLWIAPGQTSPEPLPDPLGAASPALPVVRALGPVELQSIEIDGTPASAGVLWFGTDGAPEVRDAAGAWLRDSTLESRVMLAGVSAIVVSPLTGSVE